MGNNDFQNNLRDVDQGTRSSDNCTK